MTDAAIAVVDDMPAHDLTAETAVLATVLDVDGAYDTVAGFLRADHFYLGAHRDIWTGVATLRAGGRKVDPVTVGYWLKESGKLIHLPQMHRIVSEVPVVANLADHARIVFECWQLRELGKRASAIAAFCRSRSSTNVREVLDRASRSVAEVAEMGVFSGKGAHVGEAVADAMKAIFAAADSGHRTAGLPTGLSRLDTLTNGMKAPQLWVLAARPGVGKTSLAVNNIAINVATPVEVSTLDANGYESKEWKDGAAVLVFSLEMSREALATRMICSVAEVDAHKVEQGVVAPGDFDRLTNAGAWIKGLDIWLEDEKGLTVFDIKSRARWHAAEYARKGKRLGLVVVDYLQKVNAPFVKGRNREQEVAEISRELTKLAADLGVPVLALSQFSRAVEQRGGDPRLSDLRDSGAIEQDADVIILLHRDKDAPGWGKAIVAKNRSGPTGVAWLKWMPAQTMYANPSPGEPLPGSEEE